MTPVRIVAGLLILALAGGLGWLVWVKVQEKSQTEEQGRPPAGPMAVEIAPVGSETLRDLRTLTGTLVAASEFVAAPKISGRLERLHIDIGDTVERDAIVAQLDDEEFVQQVEQSRAELDVAKTNLEETTANLEVANREYARVQTLRTDGIASESDLDSARNILQAQKARHKVAQTQVIRAEAALKAAEVRLSYTTIRASWQGGDDRRAVGERFANEGAMLSANSPIVSVLEIDPVVAVVFVAEVDYPRLSIGQEASIRSVAFPSREFPGNIVRIAPLFRAASRQARIEVQVANAEQLLKPGMFVGVEIELAVAEASPVVPIEALIDRAGRRGVFTVDAKTNVAHFVPVRLGILERGLAQILEPALEGSVVTMGHHLLEDGGAIRIVQPPGEAPRPAPEASETDPAPGEKGPPAQQVPATAGGTE